MGGRTCAGACPVEEQGLQGDTECKPGRAPEQLGDAGSWGATRQRRGSLDCGQPASSGSPWGDSPRGMRLFPFVPRALALG